MFVTVDADHVKNRCSCPDDTTSVCRAMVYHANGRFAGICNRVHDGRFAWCTEHRPPNMGNMAWIEHRDDPPVAFIPYYVQFGEVEVVGHFDVAWRDRGWQCALDTMLYQLNDYLRRPSTNGLGALRFFQINPDDVTDILLNLIGGDKWRGLQTLQVLLLESLCLQYPSSWQAVIDAFRSPVVRHVPLFAWPIAYVVACGYPTYMVVDMATLSTQEQFRTYMWAPTPEHNVSCGLYITITRAIHLQWILEYRDLPLLKETSLHLVFDDSLLGNPTAFVDFTQFLAERPPTGVLPLQWRSNPVRTLPSSWHLLHDCSVYCSTLKHHRSATEPSGVRMDRPTLNRPILPDWFQRGGKSHTVFVEPALQAMFRNNGWSLDAGGTVVRSEKINLTRPRVVRPRAATAGSAPQRRRL